jgi:sigma-B regulation protein RsbU (phosphoserine phosphatase)
MSKRRRLILGIGFFALMLVYCIAGLLLDLANLGSKDAWRGRGSHGEYYITEADPGGPAKALRAGDRILAMNGVSLKEDPRALGFSNRTPPGTPYTMTVKRGEQELTVNLTTIPRPNTGFPWSRLVPLIFWLTGGLIFLLKTDDRQARLLGLMLGSFSGVVGDGLSLDILPEWLALLIALARIAGLWSLPLMLHLFLIFPQNSPLLERRPSISKWIYAPLSLVLPTFGVSNLPIQWSNTFFSWTTVRWLSEHGLTFLATLTVVLYLLCALLMLGFSYRTADTVGRRRLRVVMWGSLIGFGSLLLVVVMEFTGTQDSLKTIWNWLQFSTILTLPLVPLSFAYAIIRHRVIPISLIIRRSVRYLLVSRGSVILEGAIVAFTVAAILTLLFRYLQPSSLTVGLITAAAAIAAWQIERWLHQRFLAPVIDRRFFRQAYDAERILTELSHSLRRTTNISQLLEMVAVKVQSALQTESLTIYLRDETAGDYPAATAYEYSPSDSRALKRELAGRLPQYAATLAHFSASDDPLELDGGDPGFSLTSNNGHSLLTAQERSALLEMKSTLLLPLKTTDGLAGAIAVGSRLGDLPFSGDDKRMLQSVAASTSLALENAQLIERMLSESRRRQEAEAENQLRAQELEEARRMQLSMLPKSMPASPFVEIAASMQTAAEVGGDYYDFFMDREGVLTIAIGDATGHGLKAGTMVTATKSLFNHLTQQSSVVDTLHDASRALKLMNLRSLFMALTLVKVQEDRLYCSVAGMPPILIYRAGENRIEELPLRGAPLGGMTNYAYHEAVIKLSPNDVVLLMSDGLPERFNPASELFEYDRTKDVFCAIAGAAPQAIIEGLLKASDEWANGRPLDDDLTLVVLKRRAIH